MNKIERDNLIYRLAQRETLIEQLEGFLANAGRLVRQITTTDKKLIDAFTDAGINFPECFTPKGFGQMFDDELKFQIEVGDYPVGSFMATIASERVSLTAQIKELHTDILAGKFDK